MGNKTKDYKQQTITKLMNRFKAPQSSHDAQKSSDVSNGGTRRINDDKTTRQDKKRRKNENGDTDVIDLNTDVIDLTRGDDEVEKKEDTHLGKRGRDDDVIILTGEGEVEEKKGTSLKERVRGGRESLVEDRPSSENSSEEYDDDDDDFDDLSSSENSSEDSDNRPNDGGNLTGVGGDRKPAVVGVSPKFFDLCDECVKRDKVVQQCFLRSFVRVNLGTLVSGGLIENEGEEEEKRIIKKIGSNRSDSFAMILTQKQVPGQSVRLIPLEDMKEWKNSEEKLGKKKKLGVLEFVPVLSAACSSKPGKLFKRPKQAPTIHALELDILEMLPKRTWDDYDEIAVVVLEFFQTGAVLKFLEENQFLVRYIRATEKGNFPQSEHKMQDSYFGIGTTSDEYKNLVKTCMDTLCSLSEDTGTELHLRSMRITNACKRLGIGVSQGANIITGLHHPVTRMLPWFDCIPYGAKIHDKTEGIKWDVVDVVVRVRYSFQRDSGTKYEEARNRMRKKAEEREKWIRMKTEEREELRKKKAEELEKLKEKNAAELKALMKTREEKWRKLTNNLYQSRDFICLKDEFMHLRLLELEVDEVYENVKKFIVELCNKDRKVVLRLSKIPGLMSRLGRKETTESFLTSLTKLKGFCKEDDDDDDDDEQRSRDVFAKLCTCTMMKSLADDPLYLVKLGTLRSKFGEEFAGCFWSSPSHVQALRGCDLEKLKQMESFTDFDIFTWEFVIEKYKKSGLNLDGANVAALEKGTTTGERWTQEDDDKLTELVEEFDYKWTLIAAFVAGRTAIQCSYRWYTPNPKPHTGYLNVERGEWKSAEDELLKAAVDQYGVGNWKEIADSTPQLNRSPGQCCYRWNNHLVFSNVSCGEWSLDQETSLTSAVEQQEDKEKMCWETVAGCRGVKHSWEQCQAYWHTVLLPKIKLQKSKYPQPFMSRDEIFKKRLRDEA